MRIAVNGWFWGQLNTGSGQYLAELVAWLARFGSTHELSVVCWAKGRAHSEGIAGARVEQAATPFDALSRNLAKLWFEQLTFPRACGRLRADVALVPYWGSPWWRPCPLVVTIHDLIPLRLPIYRGGLPQRAYTWLASRTATRAEAILADSEAGQRDIVAHLGIPSARVYAVHLAVGAQYRPVTAKEELARVRARYRLPAEPFFLYLGGFDSRKNLIRTLQAYGRLCEKMGPEAGPRLVVAGKLPAADSAFAPDPRPVATGLGLARQVHFAGWVDEADKPALYSLALATLFVSEYEGFGLPVLEAQACGCPVITSAS